MKARARVIAGLVRFGNRQDRNDAAASGEAKGTAAPKVKLLLGSLAALAATLVLGVALAGALAPVVTVQNADQVEYTTAHLEGEVNPEGHETSYHFDYITDDQYLANEGSAEPLFQGATEAGNGSTAVTFSPSEDLGGLAPATTYHLRLVATNDEGETAEDIATSTFTTKAVAKPLVSGLAATETHFSAMVNPDAPEAAPATDAVKAGFDTHWSFSCSPGCKFTGPGEGDLEADDAATEVGADPSGLTPNQAYDVTLHATNAGGEETETLAGAFTTPAVKPQVSIPASTEPSHPTSVVLYGAVNPHNSPLGDCHFAYGAGAALDQSAPCEGTLPSGERWSAVHAHLTGLEPGTGYSFRLLATNPAGSEESTTGHFATPAAALGAACPNEAIRAAQHATQLGQCRAFERVSPAAKGDGDIIAEGEAIVAAKNGDGATFESRMLFGDTVGSGVVGRSAYLARRGADGWSTHAITPPSQPSAVQVLFASTKTEVFSEDLTHTLAWGYDLPGSSDDTPNRMNLYVEDTADRSLQTVSAYQRPGETPEPYFPFEFLEPFLFGAAADLSHVAFASNTQFLPAVPSKSNPGENEYPNGSENVYTWDEGVLHLAGILPDGKVPPEGSTVKPKGHIGIRGTMSADGSRQSFISPAVGINPQLYLRIDHNRTAWISEPENPSFSGEPEGVHFEGMTPDGKNVFFVTESRLLEADTAVGPDLYRWSDGPDPEAEGNLTLITTEGAAANNVFSGAALVGMSDDGRRVYVHTSVGEIRVWEEGVGIGTADPSVSRSSIEKQQLTLTAVQPGNGRVSPDGNWVAYIKSNNDGAMYLYDRAADTVTCVSCPSTASLVPAITNSGKLDYVGFRPHFLSDDGQVFFTTTGALVPEDTNGVADVYEYDGPSATLSLLSSGKGKDPSEFADADADADGSDVFFVTRGRLVGSDHDEFVDLYDSRSRGGFAEAGPSPSPCEGEACQAAGGGSPPDPAITSRSATGGNLAKPRCAKGRKAVHRHGKPRCTKKHQKHHTKSGRGAHR